MKFAGTSVARARGAQTGSLTALASTARLLDCSTARGSEGYVRDRADGREATQGRRCPAATMRRALAAAAALAFSSALAAGGGTVSFEPPVLITPPYSSVGGKEVNWLTGYSDAGARLDDGVGDVGIVRFRRRL